MKQPNVRVLIEGWHKDNLVPDEVEEDWWIWNAPRPIYGHKEWTGPFVSGLFYAAVDPGQDRCEWMNTRNMELDAVILEWVDMPHVEARVRDYYNREYKMTVDEIDALDATETDWVHAYYNLLEQEEDKRNA